MHRSVTAVLLTVLIGTALNGCGKTVGAAQPGSPDGNVPAYEMTTEKFLISPDGTEQPKSKASAVYNDYGRPLSYESYDYDSGQTSKVFHRYTYNADGSLRTVYNSEPEATVEFSYGADGSLAQEKTVMKGDQVTVKRYTYDSHGNELTVSSDVGSIGEIQTLRHEYEYDSSGNISINREFRNDLSVPSVVETMTYDSAGRVAVKNETSYDGDRTESTVRNFTYDADGNNIRLDVRTVDMLDNVIFTSTELREFDSQGRITRQEIYYGDKLAWYEVSQYKDMKR